MYLTRTSVPTLNSPDAVAVKLLAVTAARLAADPDYWSVKVTIGSTMVLYLSRSNVMLHRICIPYTCAPSSAPMSINHTIACLLGTVLNSTTVLYVTLPSPPLPS
jgi:hypothetical protein